MGGTPVGWPFPKLYPCPEVAGSSPADYISFIHSLGDTWRPCLGHVSPTHSPPICHMSDANSSTRLPTNTCHVSYGPANSASATCMALPCVVRPCHVSIRTDCTVSTFFFCLFDDLNRTRYLSHPTSV
jgi:hypothetical protein